jgi:hypothetical protein
MKHVFGGIVFIGNHKLGWGNKGLMQHAPYWLNKAIIAIYNPIACQIWGHSHLCQGSPAELPVCCDCDRHVIPGPNDSVIKEWDEEHL